jgi:hypothetical protein
VVVGDDPEGDDLTRQVEADEEDAAEPERQELDAVAPLAPGATERCFEARENGDREKDLQYGEVGPQGRDARDPEGRRRDLDEKHLVGCQGGSGCDNQHTGRGQERPPSCRDRRLTMGQRGYEQSPRKRRD